jgi:uncharacterized protein (TIGR02145 family)
MKSTGTQHWLSPNAEASNESGFSGLPAGARTSLGASNDLGGYGIWWSSSELPASYAWYRSLDYNSGEVIRFNFIKRNGFSVRCLRD